MSDAVSTPSLTLPVTHLYPERNEAEFGWRQRVAGMLSGARHALELPLRSARRSGFVKRVNQWRAQLAQLDDAGLAGQLDRLRSDLLRGEPDEACLARSFAVIREMAHRHLGLCHYDVQIAGGYALLQGTIAELETGEGKTLTATLAAATAALAGTPVHVVTVNDYLAQRDQSEMGPLYRALGLSVGVVVSGMSASERRAAYRADITYCSNKEVAFDYLRDRILLGYNNSNLRMKLARLNRSGALAGEPVMRGLHFAIVDEADSVLIDEARTPLIISERSDPERERRRAEEGLGLARQLRRATHFRLERASRQIELTEAGRAELHQLAGQSDAAGYGKRYVEELARNALSALHLFQRDEHYLVRDDKIEVIDENTGRTMRDRSWGEGLHQMIEVKEGCSVTGQSVPIARITYQRFFGRYRRLAGMTGTAREAQSELLRVYHLPVVRIATHRPLQRVYARTKIFASSDEKWRHIVSRTSALSAIGVPVLIGTRTVATSEKVSRALSAQGITHNLLNAAQDEQEAGIIAQAGRSGQVTVATNMAGRGVDIRLDPLVVESGGLHVIMSELHDSGRIDRQLYGRCARQGDPGRVEVVLSLEDPLLVESGLGLARRRWFFQRINELLFRLAQRRIERRHARMRRDLLHWDRQLGSALAFSGRME